MANRIIPTETKVKVMQECLYLVDVGVVAARCGVSLRAIYYWFATKVQPALADVLINAPPGPSPTPLRPPLAPSLDRPAACPACDGACIWKNGTYLVINWLWLLAVGWLIGLRRVPIQRWRCAACGREPAEAERQRQAAARRACRCRVHSTSDPAHRVARASRVGPPGACRQRVARFLLFDETFPKLGQRIYSLGVVICEYGLIRSVCTIRYKTNDIPQQLRAVVGGHYQPQLFLTDLEVTYAAHAAPAGLSAQHMQDGSTCCGRSSGCSTKQRLLRKRLRPLLAVAIKAFRPGYESVCVLLLTGVVAELRNPQQVIQTASVQRLATRLERFGKKHGPAINTLLELAVTEGAPAHDKCAGEQDALLKSFSRIAKAFGLVTGQAFFAGAALMENFDVKTRASIRAPVRSNGRVSISKTWARVTSSALSGWRSHK
jgi:hypothetical protein